MWPTPHARCVGRRALDYMPRPWWVLSLGFERIGFRRNDTLPNTCSKLNPNSYAIRFDPNDTT